MKINSNKNYWRMSGTETAGTSVHNTKFVVKSHRPVWLILRVTGGDEAKTTASGINYDLETAALPTLITCSM
jgi:hypothetical protein